MQLKNGNVSVLCNIRLFKFTLAYVNNIWSPYHTYCKTHLQQLRGQVAHGLWFELYNSKSENIKLTSIRLSLTTLFEQQEHLGGTFIHHLQVRMVRLRNSHFMTSLGTLGKNVLCFNYKLKVPTKRTKRSLLRVDNA